jgi:catechol 2,3-dioxygenase-like lactoylglutathione lyase family enzyme
MPPPFRPLGIDHVVIRARDVARLRRFYCEALGCTVERVQRKLGLVQLRCGRQLIDLVDADGPLGRAGGRPPGKGGRNMDHLCLRIHPFREEALSRHLAAHGVRPSEVKSRYGAEGEGPSVYIQDPEGNTLELKGPAKG